MTRSKWLLLACASCAGGLASAADTSSTAQAGASENLQLDEVIITGTRLAVSGDSAPTPVTVIAQEQLQLAAPTSLADGLAQVPEFRGSSRPSTFVTPQGSTGAFLNLRGLGQNRVLTLWNGRRVVPTTISERVDVNTLPDLLIMRTDIVTGGASAAYGSDAVAGVVNMVLDEQFEGIKGDLGYGISSRHDNESEKARIAFGTSLLGGRGHFVGSVDYFNSDGVLTVDKRDWDLKHCNIITNPTFATDGRTQNLWRCGVTGVFTTGGMINSGPLRGTQFLSGGATQPFGYGTEVTNNVMVGGDGYWNPRGNVATPLKNKNAFAHFSFDASDDLRLWAEGSWSRSNSYFYGTSPSYVGGTAASTTSATTGLTSTAGITIYNDNAFLPASVRSSMAGNNITSFVLNRIAPDWGRNEGISDTKTYRGALGLNWDFGKWNVDWALDMGRTTAHLENNHSPNQIKLFEALDSVLDSSGKAVCRSSLLAANAARGCVPLNPFGEGSASAAAIQYAFGDGGYSDTYLKQTSSEANLRGTPFATWTGDAAFATGFAWRRFSAEQVSDPLSQTLIKQITGSKGMPATLDNKLGVFLTGNQNFQPEKSVSVGEAYFELQVPLAKDLPFLRSADGNIAYRYADYSTTGGVNAWKVGGSIEPVESIRFRFTRSRDVRAPNINELYQPALVSLGTITDPANPGSSTNIPIYNGGNENLQPEIANTLTAGVVLKPSFMPNFSMAVDYYKIKIGNSIGNVAGAQNIVNWCYQGFAVYCPLVTRLSNGALASINTYSVNQNLVVNSGIDSELNYNTHFGEWNLGIRLLASYLQTLATTDPFGTETDAAGVTGGENGGNPHWQGSLGVTLGYRDVTVFVQERYIGSGMYSNQFVVGGRASNSIDYNHVDSRMYTDLTLRYSFTAANADWQLYGTINNLFDKDPPPAPSRTGLPASILGTNPTLFDVIGRQYNVGVRFKF